MSFSRYPEYRDSGVAWLGMVPSHWKVTTVKSIARIINGYPFDAKLFDPSKGFPLVRIRDLNQSVSDTRYTGEFVDTAAIDPSDVLIGMDGDFNVGRWLGEAPALLNQRMCCVRAASSTITRYLEYVLPTPLKAINDITYSTTVKHLSSFDVAKIRVAIPVSEAEVAGIVQFLDRGTARIDALVAEQQKLIALLKEKRQAVISHAVTKGLHSDVPMKDSGIGWLGEVPTHWEVKPIRRVITAPISNGIFKKKEEFGAGVLLINVFDIYRPDFKIDFESLDRVRCDPSEISSYEVLAGDLFFVRSSLKREGIAVVAVADSCSEPVVYECHLIRARPNRKVLNGRFGSYVLNSVVYRSAMVAKAKITTMTTIDQEAILSTELPIPPLSEQTDIAAFLDQELSKFEILSAEAQRAINLLKERRRALISAAVTGKIDVRGSAALEAAA